MKQIIELTLMIVIYNDSKQNKCDGTLVYVKSCLLFDYSVISFKTHNSIRTKLCKNGINIELFAIYCRPMIS